MQARRALGLFEEFFNCRWETIASLPAADTLTTAFSRRGPAGCGICFLMRLRAGVNGIDAGILKCSRFAFIIKGKLFLGVDVIKAPFLYRL